MPKLSIITINYNNLAGLQCTLESVVNQTWQAFEYIVIDGGSTDGSAAYIESQSVHIDYWVSEPDTGIYNAMNKGIVKATGEYLLFLNSGDHLFSENVLAENYGKIENYDLVYFNLKVMDEKKSFIKNYPDLLSFSYFVKDTLPHPATFIKSILLKKIGLYDESLKIAADWKFFIESVCKRNATYTKIDETLSVFYLDGYSSEPNNQQLIDAEKQSVLHSNFNTFIADYNELHELKSKVSNIKNSRIVKFLVKIGLLRTL